MRAETKTAVAYVRCYKLIITKMNKEGYPGEKLLAKYRQVEHSRVTH